MGCNSGSRAALAAFVLTTILSGGCATTAPRITPEIQQQWAARDARLAQLDTWHFNGRVAVQTPGEGWSGTLSWKQQASGYEIIIQGPVGTGSAQLKRGLQGSELRLSEDRVFTGDSAQSLLNTHFGWDLPLDALQQWVLGRPDPSAENSLELDDAGRIQLLHQSGWDVEYKRYAHFGKNELPEKIFARSAQTQVRLFIDAWTLP